MYNFNYHRPLSVDEAVVHFEPQGELKAEATLLREIIRADFGVVSFGAHAESLEDIFMEITKGRVQ